MKRQDHRYRPRGFVRRTAGLLSPTAATAGRVALERDAQVRLRRLVAAAQDNLRQRVRPTRPRMQALSLGPGCRLVWREVPQPPPPGPAGALVRPIAIATCDVDRPLALGATPFPLPLHLGHECVAEVVAVGDEVATVRAGQRVVVPFEISCGTCPRCRSGRTANCTAVPPLSMYGFGLDGGHWGGALAERLAVPFADAMLVPLPAGMDPVAAASVADTICDGYRHVAPHLPAILDTDPDAAVVVVSAMTRGHVFSPSCPLYAGLTARALGARTVYLADARPHVREQAARLGLTPIGPKDLKGLPPSPLVADISATARGLRAALTATAPDGTCSSAGGLHRTARIPTALLYGRNATYQVGRAHTRTLIPDVLELMADQRLRPQDLITTIAPLEDAPAALREHFLGNATKTIITA